MTGSLVRDYMTETVVTVRANTAFHEIVETLSTHGISGVPVVDADGWVVGVVTEGDLMGKETSGALHHAAPVRALARLFGGRRGRAFAKADGRTAGELMSPDPITTAPDESVRAAARRMTRAGVKRLPVVVDGRLVGILARQDVLHLFDRPDAELRAAVEERLRGWLMAPPDRDLHVRVEDGIVHLTGDMAFESDVWTAERVAAGVDGVVAVENHLTFRSPDLRLPIA